MNTEKHPITHMFKIFIFTTIMCAMIFQPIAQTFILVNNSDIELADMDSKENPNERESQEEDPKEEKIELQIVNAHCYDFLLVKQALNLEEEHPTWDFDLETHIPPPEQA